MTRRRCPAPGWSHLGTAVAVVVCALLGVLAASPVPPAGASVQATAADPGGPVVPGAFVVRTDGPAGSSDRAAIAGSVGGTPGTVVAPDTFVVHVPTGVEAPQDALGGLGGLGGVAAVQPELVYQAAAIEPDDPCWRTSACLGGSTSAPGQPELRNVGAAEAWAITRGSPDVVVAVLDTLVETSPPHRDLVGKLVPGRSFVTDPRGRCEEDGANRNHGTIAAGIIAAQPGNGTDMAGLGWRTRVMPVEVLNGCGAGMTSSVALGLRWAADNGADIVNLSLTGSELDLVVSEAVAYARSRGVLVVAAAGNGSPGTSAPVWPAADRGVVAVAATGVPGTAGEDRVEAYSNVGPWVDIAAPGTDVLGLRRVGGSTTPLNGTTSATGTSFATPIVAAGAALVMAHHPSLTAEQVAARLARSAVTIPGTGRQITWGRLDVAAALRTIPAGYRLAAADGGVFSFGSAPFAGSAAGRAGTFTAATGHVSGRGYWLATADAQVHSFGVAPQLEAVARPPGAGAVVGMAATPYSDGYWLATRDGRLLAAGAAQPTGVAPIAALAHPAVGVAATGRGDGGWLVASDGGVFAFGDAGFHGSTGAMRLNQPVVGMATTPSGRGYWLVASDGGVFAFGDARFLGSTGATVLNQPVVAMTAP